MCSESWNVSAYVSCHLQGETETNWGVGSVCVCKFHVGRWHWGFNVNYSPGRKGFECNLNCVHDPRYTEASSMGRIEGPYSAPRPVLKGLMCPSYRLVNKHEVAVGAADKRT